jgi:hypothetical protein
VNAGYVFDMGNKTPLRVRIQANRASGSKVNHLAESSGSPIRLNNSKGLTIMKESGLDDRQQDKDDKIS